MRSVRRVAQRVNRNNHLGAKAFTTIGYKILEAKEQNEIATLFEVLAGEKPITDAMKLLPHSKVLQQYSSQHSQHDWEGCNHWVDWWTRERHLSKSAYPLSHTSTCIINGSICVTHRDVNSLPCQDGYEHF